MCHQIKLVVVGILMIPSTLGAPQVDAKHNLQLKKDSVEEPLENVSSGLTNDIHNIQKRKDFNAVQFQVPDDQSFRAYARMGDLEMVQFYVLVKMVDIDSQDSRNWTALMWSARYGYEEIVDFLLEHGASVNIQNLDGDTALLWAVGGGHLHIVEALMKRFANPNIPEKSGLTAVSVAAAMNREDELRVMDKHGFIDLEHVDRLGRTPLNLAATVGQASIIVLIGYIGNIDVTDNNGMGPIHWAMNLRSTSTLQACLLLCPDLTLRDNRNNTALDIAIQVNNKAGEKVLRDYMALPTSSCWLDGIEYPSKDYTFFDCKQIQCMCGGHWRHTGVFDPTCFGAGAGAGEYGETEGMGVGSGGAGFVKRQVNVLARQEIQRYDVNKTYEYPTTTQPPLGPESN